MLLCTFSSLVEIPEVIFMQMLWKLDMGEEVNQDSKITIFLFCHQLLKTQQGRGCRERYREVKVLGICSAVCLQCPLVVALRSSNGALGRKVHFVFIQNLKAKMSSASFLQLRTMNSAWIFFFLVLCSFIFCQKRIVLCPFKCVTFVQINSTKQ